MFPAGAANRILCHKGKESRFTFVLPICTSEIVWCSPNLLIFLQFRRLEPSALANVPEAISAVSFSALNINTPAYLPYLLSRFLKIGGRIVRASIQHIAQILEGGVEVFTDGKSGMQPVDGLIICAGLGARTLGGVEDKDMYPVRGQTVLLRAPWVTEGRSFVVESVSKTYIIPRQGGTVSDHDGLSHSGRR